MAPITHTSDLKKKTVKELSDLIKKKKTILIASIMNIPASQFQEMVKKLRGKAIVKVPKRNLIIRSIEHSGDEVLKQIENQINENVAILFSDMDCFDLAAELVRSKSPTKAKVGQEAPEDIEVQAGPTELTPGPAISEFGALGIQIQIEKGKIAIKESKVIAKKGSKISQGAVDIMSKLDIKPFTISLVPVAGYDAGEKKVYTNIDISTEKAIAELKKAYSKSLPFAVNIGYPNSDTIKFILLKASMNAKALEKYENTPEVNSEGGNN